MKIKDFTTFLKEGKYNLISDFHNVTEWIDVNRKKVDKIPEDDIEEFFETLERYTSKKQAEIFDQAIYGFKKTSKIDSVDVKEFVDNFEDFKKAFNKIIDRYL